MSWWYRLGRKSENGYEIQNAACGRSGAILRLRLVNADEEQSAAAAAPDDQHNRGLNYGTTVLRSLVLPGMHSERVIFAGSYFASVNAMEEMGRLGLRSIGAVKKATRKFPMEYLSKLELRNWGHGRGVVAKDESGLACMLAFVWMDRDRRYFIASSSSFLAGAPNSTSWWHQLHPEPMADPTMVEVVLPQPETAEAYYDTCGQIVQHNRHRQDTLQVEHKLETCLWDNRVNLLIFSMIVVDAWLVYSKCCSPLFGRLVEAEGDFYGKLAEGLIGNDYDRRSKRNSSGDLLDASHDGSPAVDQASGLPYENICKIAE